MKRLITSLIALTAITMPTFSQKTVLPTTYTHNGEVFVMESMKNFDTKSGGTLYQQEDHTFNEMNLIASSVTKNWDPVWEEFTDKSMVEYEYDQEGRLLKDIHYNNVAVDVTGDAEWSIYNYWTYTYGEDGKMTVKENTRNSNGEFFVCERRVFEYNEDGNLSKESISTSWSPTNDLALTSVREYTEFNENGDPVACTISSYYNNEVYAVSYESYTYDEEGNCSSVATLKEDENGNLVKQSETIYNYTEQNQVSSEIYYKNDTYTGQWGPYFRWNFIYDATYGYPVTMEYHVYSIDFLSEQIYNTYEYAWKAVNNVGVRNMALADDLHISISAGTISVSYPGTISRISIYDINGNALRIISTHAENITNFNIGGLGGNCRMFVVEGSAGTRVQKIIL